MFYPVIDTVLDKSGWIEVAAIFLILIVDQYVTVTDLFALDYIIQYLPYFILGRLIAKLTRSGYKRLNISVALSVSATVALFLFIGLELYEKHMGEKLNTILHYIRAIVICFVIYYVVLLTTEKLKANRVFMQVGKILTECSKYSLQIYLFNGYLLTAIRILICSILQIRNPFLIVFSILVGDLGISLIICKCLPRLPLAAKVCGIKAGDTK